MTDQEIMQLARDVGMAVREVGLSFTVVANGEEMQRFATFVAEREREACLAEIETGIWLDKTTEEVLEEIAAAIRARNNKENQQ